MATIFVTALLDLREDRSKDRGVEERFKYFKKLASTGIPIILYLSSTYSSYNLSAYPNVRIELCELEDLPIYKDLHGKSVSLPLYRTDYHDTINFMILMNSKIDFIQKAMMLTNATHYAWIDFNVFHVSKHTGSFMNRIQLIANSKLQKSLLVFPGCWQKGTNAHNIFVNVNWRFCGGFFIGDRDSLTNMWTLYKTHFIPTILEKNCMTWEVNFWAHLENTYGWNPSWFKSDHTDEIIALPSTYFSVVASLTTIPSRISNECIKAIDSLLPQVDRVYLSVSKSYSRFSDPIIIPEVFSQEPYASKLKVVFCDDFGPASKYLGALNHIEQNQWIFVCDDDQEYRADLIKRMMNSVSSLGVYQNRYNHICKGTLGTSGGIIHGYVGNLTHRSFLNKLSTFPIMPCARYVDDQWLSAYYYFNNITIRPTSIESYNDIFSVTENGYEKHHASNQLSALGTRDTCVEQLAIALRIHFIQNGSGSIVRFLQKEASSISGSYTYPSLPPYHPTSASFLMYNRTPLLNVRYVNYLLTPEGRYIIHDEKGSLKTENYLLTLSDDLNTIKHSSRLQNVTNLPRRRDTIQGIEDIRLYEFNGQVRLIGTQREWSQNDENRMVIGDISGSEAIHLEVIEPPNATWCEKNWIPLVSENREEFIYKWFPLQIGSVENKRLSIHTELAMPPIFERIRGSTIPQIGPDGNLWFVVHYSDETSPRTYYHMLVILERSSYRLLKTSNPFVFGRIGIEFCIGFCLESEGRIRFWYSQHDRDPMWTSVGTDAFEWSVCC
uniref:Uncharacterized protein n=1 Tax=viral metagenome TaxID=1070528 RepID=A0A6C0APC0_9ZZZZ